MLLVFVFLNDFEIQLLWGCVVVVVVVVVFVCCGGGGSLL